MYSLLISTGTSKSGEYSKSYSSIPHHSDRKSADSGPVNKKQTEGVPDDNSDRIDLHDSHSGICAPISDDGINYVNFRPHVPSSSCVLSPVFHSMIWVCL